MADPQGLYDQVIRRSPHDLAGQARLALVDKEAFRMDNAQWQEYLALFAEDIRPQIIEQDRLVTGM